MISWIFWILVFSFIIAAGFITTLPLIITLILMCYLFYTDSAWVLVVAFIFGIFLDVRGVGHIGQTSMYLLLFVFIVSLYQRKFEIKSAPFVFFSVFLGSVFFLAVSRDTGYLIAESFLNALIAASIFKFIERGIGQPLIT